MRPARPRPGGRLWLVVAFAGVGVLLIACLTLLTVGLRPVAQTVTEMSFRAPPEPPVEPGPAPRLAADAPAAPERLTLGEARPLSGDVRALLPAAEPADDGPLTDHPPSKCDRFGTQIDFVRSQSLAFRQAVREKKLVLVLHLAGNFEDPGFT